MQPLLEAIQAAPPELLISGTLLLLFGWVLYRAILMVTGGILGAAVGLGLAWITANHVDLAEQTRWIAQGAGILLGALAGISLFRFLNRMAFFLAGSFIGGWAFIAGLPSLRALPNMPEIVYTDLFLAFGSPIASILSGLLFAAFHKHLVALASATIGSLLIMAALDWPYNGLPILVLFPVGTAWQLKWGQRLMSRDQGEE